MITTTCPTNQWVAGAFWRHADMVMKGIAADMLRDGKPTSDSVIMNQILESWLDFAVPAGNA